MSCSARRGAVVLHYYCRIELDTPDTGGGGDQHTASAGLALHGITWHWYWHCPIPVCWRQGELGDRRWGPSQASLIGLVSVPLASLPVLPGLSAGTASAIATACILLGP